jgi:uncharacterized membrane protein YdjX (TVP38/TMEM64 family)
MGETGEDALSNLVHNEKQKLHATFLNNLAVAAIVGGLIAPVFGGSESSILSIAGAIVFGVVIGGLFHAVAIWCLSYLKE